MEKERQWSPAVRPFVPDVQQGEKLESPKQLEALSPPLSITNPYLCEERSRRLCPPRNLTGKSVSRNEMRKRPKQRLSTTEGMPGDEQSKHGYSSSRRTRGMTEASERPALKSNAEFCSQDKNMSSRSLDAPRRGFRGTRSAPNSSDRYKSVQADCVTFEVKMSDFPELGVVAPCSQALDAPQRPGTCWGSASPSPIPVPPVQSTKRTLIIKAQRKDPSECIHSSENTEACLQGQLVEAFSQSSCLPVTWANVASQPPKKVVPKETVNKHRPSSEKETRVQQEELASEKKKRKKKKKSKTAVGDVEALEEPVSYQEPPKFEDEEEFPDLSLAVNGTARLQGQSSVDFTNCSLRELVKKESHSEAPGLQPGDQNKHRTTAAKAIPADTKKGQRVEKSSRKKSKVPVQLDIGNMLDVLEKKRQTHKDKDTKPAILSVGGSLPVGHKNPQVVKKPWLQDKIAHNPLDSTSPLVKKGKQREVPKAKKPTPLKRVILKEREDRKQNRLLEERGLPTSSEESKVVGDVAEELGETISIDKDQQDSKDESNGSTGPSVLEEQQTQIHDETSKEEDQADEDIVEADGHTAEGDGHTAEGDGHTADGDGHTTEAGVHTLQIDELNLQIDELNLHTDELNLQTDELNLHTDERKLQTDELNLQTDERKLQTDERNLQTDELNLQTDGLNLQTDDLNLQTDGLNLQTDELNLQTDELNLQTDGLNLQTDELNLQTDERKLQTDELNLQTDGLNLQTDELNLQTDGLNLQTDELNLQTDELNLQTDELKLQTDELKLQSDELKLQSDELNLQSDELKLQTDGQTLEIREPTNQLQTRPVIQPKIHSRKFRDYCSQVLSKDVDECVSLLLKELVRFQDRLYQKDPVKARMKRRLVMGLREVLKHLKLRKVKCVVISPNCERIQSKGGLDEAVHNIIDTCREQGVPFVFALSRKALGRCVNKAVPVSLVGIFNYDGAQDHYHKMIELSSEARRAYEVMVENLELKSQGPQETPEDQLSPGPRPPPPESSEVEEPEYIKLWKKMLEKECNHKFLNFEQKFSSVPWTNDGREELDENEDEKS